MLEANMLPNGKEVTGSALAYAQYARSSLEKIAAGASPNAFSMPSHIEPTWGLLYACADGIGFYVHPSESAMALIFRGTGGKPREPIDLFVPLDSAPKAVILRPREPRTAVGRFLRRHSGNPQAEITLTWTGTDGDRSMFFFAQANLASFEKAAAGKIKIELRTK